MDARRLALLLPVVCVGAVFAHVMFVLQVLGRRGGVGVHLTGQQGHFRHLFQHHGVVDGLGRIFAPGEGTVAVADDPRHRYRVDAPVGEGIDDDLAGVLLVVLVQLLMVRWRAQGTAP